jgi:energy-coupling factor transporter ATP-binding protein EcfA2
METKQEIKLEDVFNDEKRQAIKEFIDKQEIKHMIPKELFLLRGLPGSGKSTLAKSLGGITLEADRYFEDADGNYEFDASKLKNAHNYCQSQCRAWMRTDGKEVNVDRIVVSNTFTQEWEMQSYFDMANEYGYKVFSIIVENRHGSQSVHNVPEETLIKMKNRFDIKL